MDHNEVPIAAQVNVQLNMPHPHLERQVKGRQGILRGIGRGASMRNDQEVLRGHWTHSFPLRCYGKPMRFARTLPAPHYMSCWTPVPEPCHEHTTSFYQQNAV